MSDEEHIEIRRNRAGKWTVVSCNITSGNPVQLLGALIQLLESLTKETDQSPTQLGERESK